MLTLDAGKLGNDLLSRLTSRGFTSTARCIPCASGPQGSNKSSVHISVDKVLPLISAKLEAKTTRRGRQVQLQQATQCRGFCQLAR